LVLVFGVSYLIDVRCLMLDFQCLMLDDMSSILGDGCCMLGDGCCMLGDGCMLKIVSRDPLAMFALYSVEPLHTEI
jgi:hypothetical protein